MSTGDARELRLRRYTIAVICCAAFLAVAILYLARPTQPELVVALKPNPPFLFWTENGEPSGAMVQLLERAAERSDIRLLWVDRRDGPETALAPGGGVDIWPLLAVRSERSRAFYVSEPFARSETLLVKLRGQEGQLVRRIGATSRSTTDKWIREHHPEATFVPTRDGSELAGLCQGDLDAALVETPIFDLLLLSRPTSCRDALFHLEPLPELHTHYAIAARPELATQAGLLRKSMGELARAGTLDRILNSYYPMGHYRSSETFAETRSEQEAQLVRIGVLSLIALSVSMWFVAQRFRQKARHAEAMAELRSQFLTSISHELRTPLNGVLGIASVLSSTSLDRTQREYVSLIRGSGETLLRTVNEVLDFSRLEAGKQPVTNEMVCMKDLAESVIALLAPVAQQKDLDLAWMIDPSVPDVIYSDASAIRQVITNLVGNGLKFTEEGNVSLLVSATRGPEETSILHIKVSDSGPGIPEGQTETIFDPFVRSNSARTKAVIGTGLGLNITKQLVTLLAGSIRVRNLQAGGCVFEADIPVEAPSPAGPAQSKCHVSTRAPKSALLLSKNEIPVEMLRQRLEAAGCKVTGYSNLEAACGAAQTGAMWELVVMDNSFAPDCLSALQQLRAVQLRNVPDVAGQPGNQKGCCEMVRASSVTPAVLFTSSNGERAALTRALPKATAIFAKPFVSELFCSALEALFAENPPDVEEMSAPLEVPSSPPEQVHSAQSIGVLSQALSGLPCQGAVGGCEHCVRESKGTLVPCMRDLEPEMGEVRALVVDDNPVNRKVLVSLLRILGVQSDTAEDGETALARFAEFRYTWAVMDWQMPGMDGLTAIRRMREWEARTLRPRTPTVLCSANGDREPPDPQSHSEIDAFLPKPISLASVCKTLNASRSASSRLHANSNKRHLVSTAIDLEFPANRAIGY